MTETTTTGASTAASKDVSTTYITSGTSFWARVYDPNPVSGQFELKLVVDDENASGLEALGLAATRTRAGSLVRMEGHEANKVFTFKKKAISLKDNRALLAPKVINSKHEVITDLIGNGSKVTLVFSTYDYTLPTGVKGTANSLIIVMVTDLVEFKGMSTKDLMNSSTSLSNVITKVTKAKVTKAKMTDVKTKTAIEVKDIAF